MAGPPDSADLYSTYRPLGEAELPTYLASTPVAGVLGGNPGSWRVREVGDGNLNLVSIVTGPAGGVAVKQALPYLRLVGEGWPLPLSRAHFEYLALTEEARHVPERVPAVVHYDAPMALIAMEWLTPHIILRRGMIRGLRYPHLADHVSSFIARTAFYTSDLALPAHEKRAAIARFSGNHALCKITEDLVFTEPYTVCANNRWTSPQLDKAAKSVREDGALKLAVSELKEQFLCNAQALIHGDLHTGSMMVTDTDTRMIDPEFAFYGPIGFDVGAVLANLLISYFSQPGHASADDSREDYAEWVLEQARAVWNGFAQEFRGLWDREQSGDGFPSDLLGADVEARRLAQDRYLRRLFDDSLGFAGAKMTRRILGLAHNIDLEEIEDPDRRAECELRALRLARHLMIDRTRVADIDAVLAAARGA